MKEQPEQACQTDRLATLKGIEQATGFAVDGDGLKCIPTG